MSDLARVPEIDPAGADRLAREGAVLLDVRQPDEWEAGRAPGAVLVPLATLEAVRSQLADGARVVAVCRTGARSGRATAVLNSWGYDAVNLAGGMRAWSAAGLPVVDGSGEGPGTVI